VAKEARLARRERRSARRLFEELRGHGYGGSSLACPLARDSVHRFAKAWRNERSRVAAPALVPLSFARGEAYRFDCATRRSRSRAWRRPSRRRTGNCRTAGCRWCAPPSARPRHWFSTPPLAFHRHGLWNLGQLRPRQSGPVPRRCLPPRPLRQHEDRGRCDLRWQGAPVHSRLAASVLAPF
jgi:hypothetical protein